MRISVQRSGGFAGLTEDLGVTDTAQLDPALRQRVEGLLRDDARLAQLTGSAGKHGADLFTYVLSVADGDRKHTVTFTDDGAEEIAPLRTIVEMAGGAR